MKKSGIQQRRFKRVYSLIIIVLLGSFINACSGGANDGNGIDEPMSIDDELVRITFVYSWGAWALDPVTQELGPEPIPLIIVQAEILVPGLLDDLQAVQEWDVMIRNDQGTIAPLFCDPEISYNPDTVGAEFIEASVDWTFEIDLSSGPFTLLLPGNKQISLESFLSQEAD